MKSFKIRGGLGDSAVVNPDVKLQDNLYLATNSKWLEHAEIPADRPMIGGFTELDIKIKKHCYKILITLLLTTKHFLRLQI